jgi:hypothetical protein
MVTGVVDRSEGIDRERLHWSFDVGGRAHALDLQPAAFGGSVSLELDGRAVTRMSKPTPQRPWQETTLDIDGEPVRVALTWHFPVMRTDVFVRGRSVRDGRMIDATRADAPPALTNYEAWFGAMFRTPLFGSRPRPPRGWPVVVLTSVAIWLAVLVTPPISPAVRPIAAAALLVTGLLLLAFLWSMMAFGQRVHLALLARPGLGDWRVGLWFAAFAAYPVIVMLLGGMLVLGILAVAGG